MVPAGAECAGAGVLEWRGGERAGERATSIDAIAEAASVSRSTVFTAAGDKPYLLKTVYDQAVVGDDQPVALAAGSSRRSCRYSATALRSSRPTPGSSLAP
ncbi:hypothetical protein ACWD7C_38385 [Streptomyces sp. NPDC005134]|uniref:hypothetical protein n=1 Tax=Streptomyces sp. NPDC005098 TaxID=3154560 RepID=UPI0033A8E3B8